jgi:succinyl-diaminopimelate desuccinylase
MRSQTLNLTRELIARPSVTPEDAGCQQIVVERLAGAGFHAEKLRFGEVDNLWLRRNRGAPLFAFLGHTDVVPAGPMQDWHYDPFVPTEHQGFLYGRGAADMKASIAAFVVAAADFVKDHPEHRGSIALLLTSDEEGPAHDGTRRVIEALTGRGECIDYCLVGEPTSHAALGDTIKIGRRGSLHGRLRVIGTQGHVAYPHLALNPVHHFAPALAELAGATWDSGGPHFPPTTLQITEINAGGVAENVIPGELSVRFNFRHSSASTAHSLRQQVEALLDRHEVDYELEWKIAGQPFLTEGRDLIDAVSRSIRDELGIATETSTTGGTSDGRFVAPTGAQVVELGPVNGTIHKANECIAVDDPDRLRRVYYRILVCMLT